MEINKLEKDIQREICDWLALKKFFFWRSNNVPVYAKSGDGVHRFRKLPKYTPHGLPDIICIHKGKFIALEVKRPSAELSEAQAEIMIKIIANGGSYYRVCSLADVLCISEFYL